MPWSVVKGGGSCGPSEWAVIKDSDGSTEGCHSSKEAAEAQVAALYANESAGSAQMNDLRVAAAAARAAAAGAEPMRTPRGRPERQPVRAASELRAQKAKRDGDDLDWYLVEGYASIFERGYEMWDAFGPYTEVVSFGAADETLAANPEVAFRFNHGGTPMARTGNGRLELSADQTGLSDRAWLNPTREDVKLLIQAMEDRDVTEQSFMFMISEGRWSPDYMEYRIDKFDLDRGDVGPVTYGANPYTSIAARSGEFLHDIPLLSPLVARAAYDMLAQRPDLVIPKRKVEVPKGPSIALIRAQLLVEKDED